MRYFNLATALVAPAAVGLAVGLTAGLAPAAAAPQNSPGVSMSMPTMDSSNVVLRIQGKFPMSEGAAYDRLNNLAPSGGMDYVIYADDPGENDPVITARGFVGAPGQPGGAVIATPYGLSFLREISVPRSQLNEDDGTDEVYIKVRFVQGNGAGDLVAYTNAISDKF